MENENQKEQKHSQAFKSQIGKQMSLASLEYPKFSKEIKKLIKAQKTYKDAIDTIQMYNEKQRHKLTVVEKIILNRKLAYCCNKLLKSQVIDSGEFDKNVMQNLMEKCQRSIFEGYRFINIYITKVMDNRLNLAVFSDASYLTSEDEYQAYHLDKKRVPKIDEINSQYQFDKKLLRQKKLNYKNQADYEKYDIFKVQTILENQLNENVAKPQIDIGYELTQYFLNLVKQMLNLSYVYKNQRLTPPKYKIAFFYLIEADRIMSKIIFSADPDILLLASKVKIALGSFYFEAGRSEEGLTYIEEAILICQFEIHLNQVLKGMRKQQKSIQEKKDLFGIKLLLVALNVFGMITQDLKQYQRMYEVMMLADFISQKIKKTDDLAKYTEKQVQIAENYRKFLQEEAELTWIAEVHLGVDLAVIVEKEKKELQKKNNESFKNYFIQSQLKLYKKFRNRDLKIHQYYSVNPLKEKFTKNWHIENLKKSQTPNVKFTLEKKGNPLEEAEKLLKFKNKQQKQLNDEMEGYESDEDFQFQQPFMSQKKQFQDDKQFIKIKGNQSMQSMQTNSQYQNSQKKQQSQSQIKDSNIEKNTQLSNSGSFSDSGFFNESFFAPSSDHEEDWKSSIHNSVRQSFMYRQKSAKNSHRQSFIDNQSQQQQVQSPKYNSTQNQTKKSTVLFDTFQTKSQIQLQQKQNQRPKTSKAKQQVQINYPEVKYKPQLQIQKYNKPGTHPKEPKVLTTNEYFQNRQKTSRKRINSQDERERLKNPAIRNEIKFKRIKHNLERQDDWDYEGLDSQIQSYVDEHIKDKNNFRKYNVVQQHIDQFHKMDDFDKNEFHYCRKMLHQKMLEGLKITTPQINHSDKPNVITMKGIVQKDTVFIKKKNYFQQDMEIVYEKKNQAKVDRIFNKKLKIELGQDEQELMKRKLQANQKKNLQLIIFKHREHKLFEQAKHLKELYKKYEEALQQKQRQERKQKEQAEREKENQLIMKKVKEKEVEQQEHQNQQKKSEDIGSQIQKHQDNVIVNENNQQQQQIQKQQQQLQQQQSNQQQQYNVRFDNKNLEEEKHRDKKAIQDLKSKSKQQQHLNELSKPKQFQIKKNNLSVSTSEANLSKNKLLQNESQTTSEAQVKKKKRNTQSHTFFGNPKKNNYKENLKGLSDYETQKLLEKIDKVTQKTQKVNKIISTDVDNEKWQNVELLKLSRIKLGKEKPQKEEQYDFNKGMGSKFSDLRMSILGMSQKTQFKEHKFYTFAEIATAKIRSNRQRNMIMGGNQTMTSKETEI